MGACCVSVNEKDKKGKIGDKGIASPAPLEKRNGLPEV